MEYSSTTPIAITVILVLVAALFVWLSLTMAAAEGAVARVTRASLNNLILEVQTDSEASQFLKMKKIDKIHRVQRLIADRYATAGSCAFFRIACNVLDGVLVSSIASLWGAELWIELLSGFLFAIIVAVVSVLVRPRTAGMAKPVGIMISNSRIVSLATKLTPFARIGGDKSGSKGPGRRSKDSDLSDDEELEKIQLEQGKAAIDRLVESNDFDPEVSEMLRNVLTLSDTLTREIMVPRTDMICMERLALLCTLFWFGKPNDFGLGRNMELLVNMMRELSLFYVDEVDPDQLMQDAAEGMTRNLDPYTEFLPEEQMSNFDLLTTGKYGGIGSMIRKKGDYVIFAQPYEGSPADRAGIRIGDKILSIEGEDTKGWDPAQISSALKGTPNTTVRIVIERLIGGGHDTLTLTRERIAIPSVPYAGFVAKGIGYIQHSDFTEGSYEEMRTAIEKLRTQDTLRGLILDYRGNGGGILQEAVKIVSMFVPKGTEVVRTKGRVASQQKVFRTANDPILPDLPLAVLINGNSASAAEIVAGSLQDLDRAVLIGQKSFGKGLVQTTRPLGYNTLLKLTTAKYYIPSGRCIQAIDYSSRKQDGTVGKVADSLVREFTTRGGRKVYDGGGISPDIATEPQYISRFAVTLLAMGFIEDFVDEYMQEHHTDTIDNRTFSITDADYDAFVKFMEGKEVPYESETRRVLKVLKEAAENDLYSDLAQEITAIEGDLKDDTQTNLHTYRKEIAETINNDIVLRHSYQAGVIEHNLGDDTEVLRATEVLENPTEYQEITTVQTSEKK